MTSKNNDNIDELTTINNTISQTIDINNKVSVEDMETDGSTSSIIKEISNNYLTQLKILIFAYDTNDENIYQSELILRKENNVLNILSGDNLKILSKSNNSWIITITESSNNISINFKTNGDPIKVRVQFDEYLIKTL